MAKALEIQRPYTNLKTYLEYKNKGIEILNKHKNDILTTEENLDNTTDDETE